jgi:hypothetical protein
MSFADFVFVLRRSAINHSEVESSAIVNDATVQPHQVSVIDNRQATYGLVIFQAPVVL